MKIDLAKLGMYVFLGTNALVCASLGLIIIGKLAY